MGKNSFEQLGNLNQMQCKNLMVAVSNLEAWKEMTHENARP